MKKNFTVNIGKQLFNIDEDAFEILNSYLGRLRNLFAADESRDEIMADIEMRIAELLGQKVSQKGQGIVVSEYVKEVISEMGEPGQLSDNGNEQAPAGSSARTSGKLFRDPVNRRVGGVAAGLAAFIGINPVWLRLVFLLSTFLYGSGPIVYIVLWIILPEAQTTAEKLEMQRQQINIDNLRKELVAAGSGIQKTGSSFLGSLGTLVRTGFEMLFRLLQWVFHLIGRAFGLFLIGLVLLTFVFLGLAFLVREDMGISGYNFVSVTLVQVFQWLVPSTSLQWLFYLAFAMILVSLSGLLIYSGLRLLLRWPPLRWPVILAFSMLLLAGLIISGNALYRYSKSTDTAVSVNSHTTLPMPAGRLHIQSGPWDLQQVINPLIADSSMNYAKDAFGEINLSLRPAPGDSLLVTLIRTSSATNESMAKDFASSIHYNWTISDTLFGLHPYFSMPFDDGMHYQELNVVLGIPVGRELFLDPSVSWKVRYSDFNNVSDDGGIYLMTRHGLSRPDTAMVASEVPQ
jgi:phage shock protein PspC (stress-responsive transcriptional regulator)